MKTQLKLCVITTLFLHYLGNAQTTDNTKYPETMIIKVLESGSFGITNNLESKMIIIDSDNHTSLKPLKRVNYNTDSNEGLEENAQKLRLELQMWNNKGFEVKSMTAIAPRENVTITTIILQKS